MIEIVLTISIFVIFSIMFFVIGYVANNHINKPLEKQDLIKKMAEGLEIYKNTNNELVRKLQLTEDVNKNNHQWYLTQLYNLGNYLKMKHNDDHILEQINNLSNMKKDKDVEQEQEQEQEIILEIDFILSRISSVGYDNLTQEEKEFLQEYSKNGKK